MPSVTTTQWAARFRDPCGTLYGGRNSEGKARLLQSYWGRESTQDSLDRDIWFACPGVAHWHSPLDGADLKCCLALPCSLIVSL